MHYDLKKRLQILTIYKLPTQKEVDIFNNENSHKTGEDLTKEYLQNDVEILDYCIC